MNHEQQRPSDSCGLQQSADDAGTGTGSGVGPTTAAETDQNRPKDLQENRKKDKDKDKKKKKDKKQKNKDKKNKKKKNKKKDKKKDSKKSGKKKQSSEGTPEKQGVAPTGVTGQDATAAVTGDAGLKRHDEPLNRSMADAIALLEREMDRLKTSLETYRLSEHPQRAEIIRWHVRTLDERQQALQEIQALIVAKREGSAPR